jgi:uncharacterized protein YkwD
LLVALFLSCMIAAQPSRARAASSNYSVYLPLVARAAASSIEQQVIDLTNEHRRKHGCATALEVSPELTAAASAHSRDMALRDLFSHTGSDGSTMTSRALSTGYSYSLLAENLAAGPSTAAQVVAGWMTSAGHRANILNCSFREIGVGYYQQLDDQSNVRLDNGQLGGPYRHYWTQEFGAR